MQRTVTAAIAITATIFLATILSSGRSADFELEKKHVKSLTVRNVPDRGGKNVALEVGVEPPAGVKLPRGITALINDRQVHLYDDGRWPDDRANDGVYTTAGATKDGKPLIEKSTLRLASGQLLEHHANLPAISCKFKVVECPKDCKSVIFGSKCVVCFSLEECSISF
jgi:hypothetical protein